MQKTFVCDIVTILHTAPGDTADAFIGFRLRFGEGIRKSNDVQHAAAIDDVLAVLLDGTCMKQSESSGTEMTSQPLTRPMKSSL